MSPVKAISRILWRVMPNWRNVPRARPVSSQRLRWGGIGVARKLLQRKAGGHALVVALLRVVGDGLQFFVLLRVLGDQLVTLQFTLDQSSFCHSAPIRT
jgi:hypothetical protein